MFSLSIFLILFQMLVRALTLTLATIEETPMTKRTIESKDDEDESNADNEATNLNSRRGANVPDTAEFKAMRDRMITLEKSVKTIAQNIEGFEDHDLNVPQIDPFEYTRKVQQRMDDLEKKLQEERKSQQEILK